MRWKSLADKSSQPDPSVLRVRYRAYGATLGANPPKDNNLGDASAPRVTTKKLDEDIDALYA